VLLLEDALSFRGDVEFDARLMYDRPRFVFSHSVVLRHRVAQYHLSSLTHYERVTCIHSLLVILHLSISQTAYSAQILEAAAFPTYRHLLSLRLSHWPLSLFVLHCNSNANFFWLFALLLK
jgi:hypothetical protein